MNRWDQPGVPHRGWEWVTVEDLGTEGFATQQCQMCGNEQLRYVHTMRHTDFGELRVGCVCAEKMTEGRTDVKHRENVLRNRAKRREKWLEREWRWSKDGNQYLNLTKDGYNVGIFADKYNPGKWKYRITRKHDNTAIWGKKSYATGEAVKLALFDHLVELCDW